MSTETIHFNGRIASVGIKPSKEHGTLVELKMLVPLSCFKDDDLGLLADKTNHAGEEVHVMIQALQLDMQFTEPKPSDSKSPHRLLVLDN